jgi:hypothetical protein
MASRHPATFRVSNIPQDASVQDLQSAISGALLPDENDISAEASIVPSSNVEEDEINTALVTFFPRLPKFVEVLSNDFEDIQIDTPLGDLTFDKTFYGLTQLYATAPRERIVAE